MAYIFNKIDAEEEFELLPENDYEVVLEKIEQKQTPSGKKKLQLSYRVRSDVDQEFKNRVVFEDIWEEKDNPGIYNHRRLNKLMGTQENINEGDQFDTIQDVINFLNGVYLQVHIVKEVDPYDNKEKNRVAFYKKTNHGSQKLDDEVTSPSPSESKKSEVESFFESDDCPF